MTDREAMKMALDALERITPDWRTSIDKHEQLNNSIDALRTALAQPKKEWVGLTDEERKDIFKSCGVGDRGYVAAMVETKLKEKNT